MSRVDELFAQSVRRHVVRLGERRAADDGALVSLYAGVANGVYRQPHPSDAHWSWPKKLLPVVHLGCAMFFCVDCSSDDGMVIGFEPNPHADGKSWDDAFLPLWRTFRQLMTAWVDGETVMQMFESATSRSSY
jgi:hypothetical protein